MKYLLIVFINFLTINSYCQDSLDSNFKKYSYNIITNNTDPFFGWVYSGTGFFIKRNEKLFFITARHIVIGCKEFSNSPKYRSNSILVVLHDNDGNEILNPLDISGKKILKTFQIDITNEERPENCFSPHEIADYSVIEISTPSDTIYSIEKYIHKRIPKKIQKVIMYGFPGKNYNKENLIEINKASFIKFVSPNIQTNFIFKDYNNKPDKLNYVISEDWINNESIDGSSGAPLFALGNNGRYYFAGIQSSVYQNPNLILFVKYIFIRKKINGF